MDQNFQTSFIPKKPILKQDTVAKPQMGLLLIISIFIFLAILISTAGAYFYKDFLGKDILQMKTDLDLAKNRFEPAKISQLQLLDKRLNSASEILSKHITISPIFEVLEAVTMKTVRYTNFSYTFSGDKILVQMDGEATGYRSIALQADLFTENKNLIDPAFSNISLDAKGNVLFKLGFSVDKSFVNYKEVLKKRSEDTSNIIPPDNTGITN